MRQFGGMNKIVLQRRHLVVVVAGAYFDAGGFEPHHAFVELLLGAGGRAVPAGGFEDGEAARLFRRRQRIRPPQTGRAGIAADADDDFMGDLPHIFQRGA